MNQGLSVSYEPDTDGTGKLVVGVCAGAFSGLSSAWFHQGELLDFARYFASTYPLPAQGLPKLRGGYWSESSDQRVLAQPHVELEFYPVGSLGVIGCRVELATASRGVGRLGQESRVGVELLTAYEPLGRFARALETVVRGEVHEAVLEAHET
jgi:hypothetical protein